MGLLSAHNPQAAHIWLVDANPLLLEEPPSWWQQLVYDYDKMLRIMPSQREHLYRLCRLVRQEARLGLSQMIVHEHPDTRACIKFGVVPVAALQPWAIRSNKIIRDLLARDSWRMYGGDPTKIADAIEAQEDAAKAVQQEEQDADFSERASNAFRAIKYGRPEQFVLGQGKRRAERTQFRDLPSLPPLTPHSANFASEIGGAFDVDGLQNSDRVSSVAPPEGTVTLPSKIVITDL